MSYSKEEISRRNKKYRENNLEKLRAYDRTPARKEGRKIYLRKKRKEDPCRFIYYSAKYRSKIAGIIFEISKQDIQDIYPADNKCPILGIPLKINEKSNQDDSPSLDRIIPDNGYVKDNIIVISYRANRIKNDATLEELKKIVCFLETKECK